MNWVDIAIVAIVLISALISLFRGFVREILSLVAWVVALWAAAHFARPAASLLEPYTSIETVRLVLGFIAVLVLALLVTGLANFLIGRLLAKTGLTGPDRVLGVGFGVLRGVAIVAAVVFCAGLTALPGAPAWQQARLIPPFETLALLAVGSLPPDVGRHFSY